MDTRMFANQNSTFNKFTLEGLLEAFNLGEKAGAGVGHALLPSGSRPKHRKRRGSLTVRFSGGPIALLS